jgi:hypothetical protein
MLEWAESGVPLDSGDLAALPHGYGRELIEQALPYSLGARTSFVLKPDGALCTIDLPLEGPGEHGDA